MSYTFAKLPRAGLGNMLFVWARAEVFAYLNQIPVFTSSWTQPRLGPTLRREKGKRIYWRYFRKTSSLHRWHQWWSLASFTHVFEPTVEVLSLKKMTKRICTFSVEFLIGAITFQTFELIEIMYVIDSGRFWCRLTRE